LRGYPKLFAERKGIAIFPAGVQKLMRLLPAAQRPRIPKRSFLTLVSRWFSLRCCAKRKTATARCASGCGRFVRA